MRRNSFVQKILPPTPWGSKGKSLFLKDLRARRGRVPGEPRAFLTRPQFVGPQWCAFFMAPAADLEHPNPDTSRDLNATRPEEIIQCPTQFERLCGSRCMRSLEKK